MSFHIKIINSKQNCFYKIYTPILLHNKTMVKPVELLKDIICFMSLAILKMIYSNFNKQKEISPTNLFFVTT